MSVKCLNYVWEQSEQKGAALLVLLAIADGANDDGFCWLGMAKLAAKARQTEDNTRRYIRQLESAGQLIVYERKHDDDERNHSNLYKLVMPGTSEEPPPDLRGRLTRREPKAPHPRKTTGDREIAEATPATPVKSQGETPVKSQGRSKYIEPRTEKDSAPLGAGRVRQPDLLFDAVKAHVFRIDGDAEGGRIAKIAHWLKGKNEGKGIQRVGLISKPAEPQHVAQFAAWCAGQGFTPPLDLVKFVEQWRRWATAVNASTKSSPQSQTPFFKATAPLSTPSVAPEDASRLLAEARASVNGGAA